MLTNLKKNGLTKIVVLIKHEKHVVEKLGKNPWSWPNKLGLKKYMISKKAICDQFGIDFQHCLGPTIFEIPKTDC